MATMFTTLKWLLLQDTCLLCNYLDKDANQAKTLITQNFYSNLLPLTDMHSYCGPGLLKLPYL